MPIAMSMGRPPPNSPRHLPEKYRRDVLLWKNVPALVGTIFLVIGVPLILAFGFGLIFVAIGYFIRRKGIADGEKKLAALERGYVTQGQILGVGQDFSVQMNGRSPYRIEYVFQANGTNVGGSVNTWDLTSALRQPGQPTWVVYLPENPAASSLWPPVV